MALRLRQSGSGGAAPAKVLDLPCRVAREGCRDHKMRFRCDPFPFHPNFPFNGTHSVHSAGLPVSVWGGLSVIADEWPAMAGDGRVMGFVATV